jgi:hypothetical protein
LIPPCKNSCASRNFERDDVQQVCQAGSFLLCSFWRCKSRAVSKERSLAKGG